MSETLKIRLPGALKAVRVQGAASGEALQGSPDGEGSVREEAYREGSRRAAAEWKDRFSEVLERLDREAVLLNACRCEYLASLEQSVVDLGVAVAEKFLISERERRRYSITEIVRSVMERLDHRGGKLTVALNPEDLEDLDGEKELAEDGPFQAIRLVADPAVPPAGCRLDTGLGHVAFSLEEQMEEIRRILMEMEVPEHDGSDP